MTQQARKPTRTWVRYLNVIVFGICAFDVGLILAERLSKKSDLLDWVGFASLVFATAVFGWLSLVQVRKAETH